MQLGRWRYLGTLALTIALWWSPGAMSSAQTRPCLGGLALPQLEGIMPALASCTDVNPETFEEATRESFCACQEEVFSLVRKSTPPAALEKGRHHYLGGELFQQALENYGAFLEEIKKFESLYDFEQGENLDCHINQGVEAGMATCSERQGQVPAFIEQSFTSAAPTKVRVKSVEEFLRQKSLQINHRSEEVAQESCLSEGLSEDLGKMVVEMIFDQSRALFLAHKDGDERLDLLTLLKTSLRPEHRAYMSYLNDHPLSELLGEKEDAKLFLDWLEQNPEASVYELFNGQSSHPLALKQKNKFVTMCSEIQGQLSAAIKEGVCGERVIGVAFELSDLTSWLGADSQLSRQEALMARFCSGGGNHSALINLLGENSDQDIRQRNDLDNLRQDSQFCQQICRPHESGKAAACEQKSTQELGEILKTSQCQEEGSCLELKALVRLRERVQEKHKFHIELGTAAGGAQSVFARNLMAQGVPLTELSGDSIRPAKKSGVAARALKTGGERGIKPPREGPPSGAPETSFSGEFAKSMNEAFSQSFDRDHFGDDKNFISAGSFPSVNPKGKSDHLAKDKRARVRDEEAKRLRQAIAELEQLGESARADIDELNDLPIPYARGGGGTLGEDTMGGDSPPSYRSGVSARRSIFADDQRAGGPVAEVSSKAQSARATGASEGQALAGAVVSGSSAGAVAMATGRTPASVAGGEGSLLKEVETPSLRFRARDLDQLGPELMEQRGLADEEGFMLEVVLAGQAQPILIPVKKRLRADGAAIWEPQLTSENKEYFERVLEVPLFKDFKLELINSHFQRS